MIPLLFEVNGEGYLVVVVKLLGWQSYDCRWWGNEISHKYPSILKADVDIEEEHRLFSELKEARQFMKEVLNRE